MIGVDLTCSCRASRHGAPRYLVGGGREWGRGVGAGSGRGSGLGIGNVALPAPMASIRLLGLGLFIVSPGVRWMTCYPTGRNYNCQATVQRPVHLVRLGGFRQNGDCRSGQLSQGREKGPRSYISTLAQPTTDTNSDSTKAHRAASEERMCVGGFLLLMVACTGRDSIWHSLLPFTLSVVDCWSEMGPGGTRMEPVASEFSECGMNLSRADLRFLCCPGQHLFSPFARTPSTFLPFSRSYKHFQSAILPFVSFYRRSTMLPAALCDCTT